MENLIELVGRSLSHQRYGEGWSLAAVGIECSWGRNTTTLWWAQQGEWTGRKTSLSVRHPIKLPVLPANSFGTCAAVKSCRSCRCAKLFPDYLSRGKSLLCFSPFALPPFLAKGWIWMHQKNKEERAYVAQAHSAEEAVIKSKAGKCLGVSCACMRVSEESSSQKEQWAHLSCTPAALLHRGCSNAKPVPGDRGCFISSYPKCCTALTRKTFSCSKKRSVQVAIQEPKWSARNNCTHQTWYRELWGKAYKQPLPWRGSPTCCMLPGHWPILKHLGLELFIYLFILQRYRIVLKCFSLPSIFPQMFQYKL